MRSNEAEKPFQLISAQQDQEEPPIWIILLHLHHAKEDILHHDLDVMIKWKWEEC